MSEESLESILEAARKLPPDEQRRLAEQLIKDEQVEHLMKEKRRLLEQAEKIIEQAEERLGKARAASNQTQRALEAVEKTRGSMKGLNRDTIIWLAEDEELCG